MKEFYPGQPVFVSLPDLLLKGSVIDTFVTPTDTLIPSTDEGYGPTKLPKGSRFYSIEINASSNPDGYPVPKEGLVRSYQEHLIYPISETTP